MADAHKNFAASLVATAPSPATSGTSLVVTTGEGVKFPAVPFNVTIWPAGAQPTTANAEVVRVTAVSTDTLTIVRAQEGSTARTVVVGDQIAATITAKTLTDAENFNVGGFTVPARTGATRSTFLRWGGPGSNGSTLTNNTEYIIYQSDSATYGGVTSDTNPGWVSSIRLFVSGTSYEWSEVHRLRVYHDGESVPTIDAPMSALIGTAYTSDHRSKDIVCHVNSNANNGSTYCINLPMPYKTSIKVSVGTPNAGASGAHWSIVESFKGANPAFGQGSAHRKLRAQWWDRQTAASGPVAVVSGDVQSIPTYLGGDFGPATRIGTNTGGSVTAATNATPIAITTAAAHGRTTGDTVTIAGVTTNTAANGTFVITVTSGTTFTLNSSVGNGVAGLTVAGWSYAGPAITSGATSITVQNAAALTRAFPVNTADPRTGTTITSITSPAPNLYCWIGAECVQVTAISGNTLTVTRGVADPITGASTTAVSHNSDDFITRIIGPGRVWGLIYLGGAGSSGGTCGSSAWMEGPVWLNLDTDARLTASSIYSGGTEDFFGNGWYFGQNNLNANLIDGFDMNYLMFYSGIAVTAFRRFERDPVLFNYGFGFGGYNGEMNQGGAKPGAMTTSSVVYFYTEN